MSDQRFKKVGAATIDDNCADSLLLLRREYLKIIVQDGTRGFSDINLELEVVKF
jgi:hypothetical protein